MNAHGPIVVGVDGSESAEGAVRWAARNAVRRSAPLHLISTVVVAGRHGVPADLPQAFANDHEREGNRHLARATEVARAEVARAAAEAHPLTIEPELTWGHPADILLQRTDTARLLAVGSHGRGDRAGGRPGSVGATIAAHARCPVAVIGELAEPEGADGGPVVVGVDGSRNSEPALAEAFTEAALRGVELVAVHAWSDTNISSLFDEGRGLDWKSIHMREEAQLAERLAGFGENFPEVHVTRVVVKDRPARQLAELAERAQLVVVGCRGRGGFTGMLLGSTSRALMHTVTRPLLIVHPPH